MELQEFKSHLIDGIREFYCSKFSQNYDRFDFLCMSLGLQDQADAKNLINEYSASIALLANKINALEDSAVLSEFKDIKWEEDTVLLAFVMEKFGIDIDHEKYALISALYSI